MEASTSRSWADGFSLWTASDIRHPTAVPTRRSTGCIALSAVSDLRPLTLPEVARLAEAGEYFFAPSVKALGASAAESRQRPTHTAAAHSKGGVAQSPEARSVRTRRKDDGDGGDGKSWQLLLGQGIVEVWDVVSVDILGMVACDSSQEGR